MEVVFGREPNTLLVQCQRVAEMLNIALDCVFRRMFRWHGLYGIKRSDKDNIRQPSSRQSKRSV